MREANSLDILFNPKSIAVVGASRNPSTPNYNLLANLVRLKFQGRLYPVNPNVPEIDGMKAYPGLCMGNICRSPTAEGVSHATTRTVVTSALAVLGLDFILTAFMFRGVS